MSVGVQAHPTTVLFISPLEMAHPVTERLQSVRCQPFPNGGNLTIKKRSSNFIQLTAHPHLTSQGLGGQEKSRINQDTIRISASLLFYSSLLLTL